MRIEAPLGFFFAVYIYIYFFFGGSTFCFSLEEVQIIFLGGGPFFFGHIENYLEGVQQIVFGRSPFLYIFLVSGPIAGSKFSFFVGGSPNIAFFLFYWGGSIFCT